MRVRVVRKEECGVGGQDRRSPIAGAAAQPMAAAALAAPGGALGDGGLEGMKMSELRKCAADIGVTRDDIARAIDSEQPKRSLIDSVANHLSHNAPGLLDLVVGLRALRQSALEDRAQLQGVSENELVKAIDDADPKGAIIRLIVQCYTQRGPATAPASANATHQLKSTLPVCPFCAEPENTTGGRTRQRRELKSERKTPKSGRWWKQLGYDGPKCEYISTLR